MVNGSIVEMNGCAVLMAAGLMYLVYVVVSNYWKERRKKRTKVG